MSLNEPIGLETRDHMITCCTVDRVATRATRAKVVGESRYHRHVALMIMCLLYLVYSKK